MLHQIDLPTLQEGKKQLHLIFLYKVVEGLVPPAQPPGKFLTLRKSNTGQIGSKAFTGCVVDNIVTKSSSNNSNNPLKSQGALQINRNNSFFVYTVEEWNQLKYSVLLATTIDILKNKSNHRD